jgi:hypothetical protein
MYEPIVARRGDPVTSKLAAGETKAKRATQRMQLLAVYAFTPLQTFTDRQASMGAGLVHGGWKRCSELRALGWIAPVSNTRQDGRLVMVCGITDDGMKIWQSKK